MSVIYNGVLLEQELTKNARGGTEQMRDRLIKNIDKNHLENVAIHFSRPKKIFNDVSNILYLHDLAEDPAVSILAKDHDLFEHFVFVSYWQRDEFIRKFNLPYSKCSVIHNSIETNYEGYSKPDISTIRFIYHTTPHRGLELVYPIFDRLCQLHNNIHLDVFSSFGVYGWEQRDEKYKPLFQKIENHPHMTYHGAKSNKEVINALHRSDIFLYPSIWKETSCIALIEAMSCGVFSIYPSYGALPETGSMVSNTGMYDYHEDPNENAISALNVAHNVISRQRENPKFLKNVIEGSTNINSPHSIIKYKQKWESLLTKIKERKQNG